MNNTKASSTIVVHIKFKLLALIFVLGTLLYELSTSNFEVYAEIDQDVAQTEEINELNSNIDIAPASAESALLLQRRIKISTILKTAAEQLSPAVIVNEALDAKQKSALDIALNDQEFLKFSRAKDGTAYLNEVFSIDILKRNDSPEAIREQENPLLKPELYKVELYNFGLNLTSIAVVDLKARKLLSRNHLPNTQPDLPNSLVDLGKAISLSSKEVRDALGAKPDKEKFLMSATKTALNGTRCERSRHLCVAPTYIKNEKALWVIVDLTDLKIAGIRWTNVGKTGPAAAPQITERKLQDDKISTAYCERQNSFAQAGWKLSYHLTSSDGLEISNVFFKGKKVLDSVKVVDWHVRYSETEGFGYADAIGCPIFSQAAVVANKAPQITQLSLAKDAKQSGPKSQNGFRVTQEYFNQGWPTPCNYNYVQHFDFYPDGSFRTIAGSVGRGCGNDGTYAPIFRIAFASPNSLSEFKESSWNLWRTENWVQQTPLTEYFDDRFQFKIGLENNDFYYLEPARGQFADGGRGDYAFLYATKPKTEEGDGNLVTLGSCCNRDFRQGPEQFIDNPPESIANSKFILWYVPQLKNDDRKGQEYCWAESYIEAGITRAKTYPCLSGPKFIFESASVQK